MGRYKRQRWWSHKAAKEHGWFSRRNETDEANRAADERYRDERGPAARKRRAMEREG